MCDSYDRTEKYVDESLRSQRLLQLRRWIVDDRGDPDLKKALRLWRDDVIRRIPEQRPLVIRLPDCFVDKLRLASPWVRITHENAIASVEKRSDRVCPADGPWLVPPQPLEIVLGHHSE